MLDPNLFTTGQRRLRWQGLDVDGRVFYSSTTCLLLLLLSLVNLYIQSEPHKVCHRRFCSRPMALPLTVVEEIRYGRYDGRPEG